MLLVYYMLIINILAFTLYGIDKKKAEKDKFRIPESRLILLAVLGGAFGALLGMVIFHHKTRKKKFRITVPVFVFLYAILMGYFLFNNFHLVISEYEYSSFEVPAELDGYTIVQISDLHNQIFGIGESVLLDKIKKCDPDIIVVTGDAVDLTHTNYKITENFFKGAVEIAPVYYISGNHEKWLRDAKGKRYEEYIGIVEGYGVNYIDDKQLNMQYFTLEGVADWSLGDSLAQNESNSPEGDGLTVMLAHEPQYLDSFAASGVDLVLSGHNHGGQIVIPGKGGLVSAEFEFFPELCEGEHVNGDTTMIISRGLGNSLFPVRINNYPEIVKVVLKREEHKLMHLYMPDVVGTNIESAENKLRDLGFFNIVIEYEKNESSESGIILRQSIPPDTTVSTEFEITLYVAE